MACWSRMICVQRSLAAFDVSISATRHGRPSISTLRFQQTRGVLKGIIFQAQRVQVLNDDVFAFWVV